MKQYGCYLFDADGTLIDTAELIFQCFLNTCRQYGGFVPSRDDVLRYMGLPLRRQIEHLLGPQSDEKAEEICRFHMDYQCTIHGSYLRVFPSVPEGLALLKQKDRRLAVVTSRRMETLEPYLRKCGIWDFFDAVVTPEMTERHKPDPEPAHKALLAVTCDPPQALFIGDSVWDIECGRNAGTDTALVAWSTADAGTIQPPPTHIINDLRELAG